jgi:hypothetical protein
MDAINPATNGSGKRGMSHPKPPYEMNELLNLTHSKSDVTHYGNVRHTAAKYDTPSLTHLGGKCKGDRLQFSEQVIIIECKKFILQEVENL